MKNKLPWSLIISKLKKNLSQEDEINFNRWLLLENNQELFRQLEIVWDNIQNKIQNYEPDLEYYWLELSKRIQTESNANSTSVQLPEKSKSIPIKRFYRMAAAASVFLAITLMGTYYAGTNKYASNQYNQTYTSLTGKSKIILPDGTEVWLHSNSSLTYNSNLHSNKREVSMTGEAYFSVTHDATKPFIVHTNGVSVQVYGTKFNVNSNLSSEDVTVSLIEGSVSMKSANKEVFLKPGQEGVFDRSTKTLEENTGDVEFAKSWADNQLRFENKDIRYVCRYLSKWYSVNIDVNSNIPNNQSYTFTVRNESLEEIVRLMSRINPISYRFDNNNNLTLTSYREIR